MIFIAGEIVTPLQLLAVNLVAGAVSIIIGQILRKKEKHWGIYIILLGVVSIVVNVIRALVTM